VKKKFSVLAVALLSMALASCGGSTTEESEELTGTALAVSLASKMTKEELAEASKAEFEANPTGKFKVVGLTSVLKSIAKTVAKDYEWIRYGTHKEPDPKDPSKEVEVEDADSNVTVNNSYKDYALLEALNVAENTYFADYALVQDVRYFSSHMEDGITHNFVPSDWRAIGLQEEDTLPLKGVHFNKLFWTNTNFEKVTGKTLYNIWQVAGTSADADHLSKVSFQDATTEQINMSFLVTAYSPKEQKRIEDAYEAYYGRKWAASGDYKSAGEQWVDEFIKNISRWHGSDGTAMKQTQLVEDWNEGYVYYGAFAKMKDAVKNYYKVDLNGDGTKEDDETYTVECDGVTYEYSNASNGGKGTRAMDTVKWDWDIAGFNGYMYCMDSQIINKAEFPYTACLFARVMLEEEAYTTAIYNSSNPDAEGNAANQYGYYYPGTASSDFRYAKGDWTKEVHIRKELNEDYDYLKDVSPILVNKIQTLIATVKA